MIRINANNPELKNLIDYNCNNPYFYVYKDKNFTGIVYEQDEQGNLIEEMTFKEGELDGKSREWTSEGVLISEIDFQNGKEHGICKNWYPNGFLSAEYFFENGECLYGKSWHDNGIISDEYKDNISKHYDEYKNLIRIYESKKDGYLEESYFSNGSLKIQKIKNAKYSLMHKEWNEKGLLISSRLEKASEAVENRFKFFNRKKRISVYYSFEKEFDKESGKLLKEQVITGCWLNHRSFAYIDTKEWNQEGTLIKFHKEPEDNIRNFLENREHHYFLKMHQNSPFSFK